MNIRHIEDMNIRKYKYQTILGHEMGYFHGVDFPPPQKKSFGLQKKSFVPV